MLNFKVFDVKSALKDCRLEGYGYNSQQGPFGLTCLASPALVEIENAIAYITEHVWLKGWIITEDLPDYNLQQESFKISLEKMKIQMKKIRNQIELQKSIEWYKTNSSTLSNFLFWQNLHQQALQKNDQFFLAELHQHEKAWLPCSQYAHYTAVSLYSIKDVLDKLQVYCRNAQKELLGPDKFIINKLSQYLPDNIKEYFHLDNYKDFYKLYQTYLTNLEKTIAENNKNLAAAMLMRLEHANKKQDLNDEDVLWSEITDLRKLGVLNPSNSTFFMPRQPRKLFSLNIFVEFHWHVYEYGDAKALENLFWLKGHINAHQLKISLLRNNEYFFILPSQKLNDLKLYIKRNKLISKKANNLLKAVVQINDYYLHFDKEDKIIGNVITKFIQLVNAVNEHSDDPQIKEAWVTLLNEQAKQIINQAVQTLDYLLSIIKDNSANELIQNIKITEDYLSNLYQFKKLYLNEQFLSENNAIASLIYLDKPLEDKFFSILLSFQNTILEYFKRHILSLDYSFSYLDHNGIERYVINMDLLKTWINFVNALLAEEKKQNFNIICALLLNERYPEDSATLTHAIAQLSNHEDESASWKIAILKFVQQYAANESLSAYTWLLKHGHMEINDVWISQKLELITNEEDELVEKPKIMKSETMSKTETEYNIANLLSKAHSQLHSMPEIIKPNLNSEFGNIIYQNAITATDIKLSEQSRHEEEYTVTLSDKNNLVNQVELESSPQIDSLFNGIESEDWNIRISSIWSLYFLPDSDLNNITISKKLKELISKDSILLIRAVATCILIKRYMPLEKGNAELHGQQGIDFLLIDFRSYDENKFVKRIEQREAEIIYEFIKSSNDNLIRVGLGYLAQLPISDKKIFERCQVLKEEVNNDEIKEIALQAHSRIQEQIKYNELQDEKNRQMQESRAETFQKRYGEVQDALEKFYIAHNKLHSSIFEKYDISLSAIHFNLSLTDAINKRKESLIKQEEVIELAELFTKSTESNNNAEKILVAGDAGVGKSTLCQAIVYQWAKNGLWQDHFNWVFLIPIRNLTSQCYPNEKNYTLEDIIQKECFDVESCSTFEAVKSINVVDAIRELITYNYMKCLFIIDGYNELPDELSISIPIHLQQLIDSLILDQRYSTLVTTRPQFLGDRRFDYSYTLKYLTPKQVQKCIEMFFIDKDKAYQLEKILEKDSSLSKMACLPFNLLLLCVSYKFINNHPTQYTLTDLYKNFIYDNILDKKTLLVLTECAFKCFTESRLIFSQEELPQIGNINQLNEIPFISKLKSVSTPTYMFLYQGFQEFLAAQHLMKNLQEHTTFIKENKYNPRYMQLLTQLAGCLRNNVDELEQYFRLLLDEPHDLYGYYEAILFIKCIECCTANSIRVTKVAADILERIIIWVHICVAEMNKNEPKKDYLLLKETIIQSSEIRKFSKIEPWLIMLATYENSSQSLILEKTNTILSKQTLNAYQTDLIVAIDDKISINDITIESNSSDIEPKQEIGKQSFEEATTTKNAETEKFEKQVFVDVKLVEKRLEDYLSARKVEMLSEEQLEQVTEIITDLRKLDDKFNSSIPSTLNDKLIELLSDMIQLTKDKRRMRTYIFDKLFTELIYSINYLINYSAEKSQKILNDNLVKLLEFPEIHAGQRQIVQAILSSIIYHSTVVFSPFLSPVLKILNLSKNDIYVDKVHMETVLLKEIVKLEKLSITKDEAVSLTLSLNNFILNYLKFLDKESSISYASEINQNIFIAALLISEFNGLTLLTFKIFVKQLSVVDQFIDKVYYLRAIKFIANTDLASFITQLDKKMQLYLFENVHMLFKATTMKTLIEEIIKYKEYKNYYPFLEKLLVIKKVAVIEIEFPNDNNKLKFFEDNKNYAFNISDFPEFFLKIKNMLKTIFCNTKTADKTQVLIDQLHEDLVSLENNNELLEVLLRRKKQELSLNIQSLKNKLKSLPEYKQVEIMRFFVNKNPNVSLDITKELLLNQETKHVTLQKGKF